MGVRLFLIEIANISILKLKRIGDKSQPYLMSLFSLNTCEKITIQGNHGRLTSVYEIDPSFIELPKDILCIICFKNGHSVQLNAFSISRKYNSIGIFFHLKRVLMLS